jgi:hypothetical protein
MNGLREVQHIFFYFFFIFLDLIKCFITFFYKLNVYVIYLLP